ATGTTFSSGVLPKGTTFQPSNPNLGPMIQCPNSLTANPCVTMLGQNTGPTNALLPADAENLIVQGIGATPTADSIGIEWLNGYQVTARNIKATNFDTCSEWGANNFGGDGYNNYNYSASKCASHYYTIDANAA